MKKELLIIASIFILLSINFILAQDVAYILKNSDRPNEGFWDVFDDMDLEVDLIEDKDIMMTDFSDYDLIFIGNDRLRHAKHIPTDMPTIVANKWYAKMFGFLDRGTANQLASNSKLKVKKGNVMMGVYKRARFKLGGISIPYYYLPNRHQSSGLDSVATTSLGKKGN